MRVFRRWVYRLRHSRSLFPAFGALVVVVSVALLATIAVFSIRGEQAATTAVQQENGRLAERNQVLNDLAAQEAQLAQAEAQLTLLVRDDLSNQQANKAEVAQLQVVIAQLEASVNRLCQIDGCNIPPASANVGSPESFQSPPSTTTTVPRQKKPGQSKKPPPTTTTTVPRTPPTTRCVLNVLLVCVP
jgi:hypothetical protein